VRIVRLSLERYGHVTGETIEFPDDRGLHIVLGANEAGKSTALEAIADTLFGFEHKTNRAFLHPAETLRVGLALRGADGREAAFVRRKGRQNTLLNACGDPVPETALSPFLGGANRERFQQVFGLDAAQLRSGGAAILTEQGEAGAAILQAQTGLRGLREAISRLDDEAKALHGDGRGVRRIGTAAMAVKENRRLMAERSLSGDGYRKALANVAAIEDGLACIKIETDELRSMQARLERVRRTAPVRGILAQATQDLAKLGRPPPLPADAADQRQTAFGVLDRTRRDRERDLRQMESIHAELDVLQDDSAVLSQTEAITRFADDRTLIAGMRVDHSNVSRDAHRCLHDMDGAAARLGLPERGLDLQTRIPDVVAELAIGRLLDQHTGLSGACIQAAAALEDAREVETRAESASIDHPPPEPAAALRDAIDAANREGRIDEALAQAEAEHAAAAADAAHLLANLPLWSRTAAELASSPVPLEAEVQRLAAALDDAQAAVASTQRALDAHDDALTATRAELQGVAAAGPMPTLEALVASRMQRDKVWGLIRRHRLSDGPAPTEDELVGLGTVDALPDVLDRLLGGADELADRRLSEAGRVSLWERLRSAEARDCLLRDGLLAKRDAAQSVLDRVAAAWGAAWRPAGVHPLDPAAMRDWARSRTAVLTAGQAQTQAARRLDTTRARHGRVLGGMQKLLPGIAPSSVGDLQRAATQLLLKLEAATAAFASAQAKIEAAREQRQKADLSLAKIGAKLEAWRKDWSAAVPKLGLALDAPVEDAAAALRLWSDIRKHSGEWDAAKYRLQQMGTALQSHDQALAALATVLALPISDALVPHLTEWLATAQAAKAERERLMQQRSGLAEAIAVHEKAIDDAESGIAALCRLAGAQDDAGLATAIQQAAAFAALTKTVQERRAELGRLDDGKTIDELEQEAAAFDIDFVPGRLQAIGVRLTELDAARTEQAGRQADARATLQAMHVGQDVSGPAQTVQDSLAEIEDAVARYVRLRLAHALLQGGLAQYRRGQQGPLLARAGAMFTALTEGRYDRLELDESDKGEAIIVAARPDGSHCNAEHLSEGTRDQLFLALRLASIAMEAEVSEPLPLIADDLLVNFDDRRAGAALRLLAAFGQVTQVILFTHHAHIADMADSSTASLHHLPRKLLMA